MYFWEPIRPLEPLPPDYRQRPSNVQAALALEGLQYLDEWTARTQQHASRMSAILSGVPGVRVPTVPSDRTHAFYEKYGGKTLVIARFIPIVRTFAPFVAGIGQMAYTKFIGFCIGGGLLWIWGITLLGYWFGNREFVKKNFGVVIIAIIVISVVPAVIEFLKARSAAKNSSRA